MLGCCSLGEGYFGRSLSTNHLTAEQVINVLKEMWRVARRKISGTDLYRHPLAFYLYKIHGKIFLQKFTQEVYVLTVLRSFIPDELKSLASEARLKIIKVERRAAFRLVLSCEKKA